MLAARSLPRPIGLLPMGRIQDIISSGCFLIPNLTGMDLMGRHRHYKEVERVLGARVCMIQTSLTLSQGGPRGRVQQRYSKGVQVLQCVPSTEAMANLFGMFFSRYKRCLGFFSPLGKCTKTNRNGLSKEWNAVIVSAAISARHKVLSTIAVSPINVNTALTMLLRLTVA